MYQMGGWAYLWQTCCRLNSVSRSFVEVMGKGGVGGGEALTFQKTGK